MKQHSPKPRVTRGSYPWKKFVARRLAFLSLLVILVARPLCAQVGTIVTVAGNGTAGFSGDGAQSTSASFNTPVYAAIARDGSLYIADWMNNRIRRVLPTGVASTFAGNGTAGFSGDFGPAAAASLNQPLAVAVDQDGNVYIADTVNSRIRKVDAATGIIRTVAGNGVEGFGGDNGPAVNASLDAPTRIALDLDGNLYIADQNNMRIRKVDALTGAITTVAGSGPPGRFNGAYSGDGGPATSARFNHPTAVTVDSAGNIYVSDQLNHVVRKVNTAGIISTFAGNGIAAFSGDGGPAASASLNDPAGLAVDAVGNLYIGDNVNNRVRKVDTNGIISTVIGNGSASSSGDNGPATNASINNPFGVALDPDGNLYVVETTGQRIRKVFSGVPPFHLFPAVLHFDLTPDSPPQSQTVTLSAVQPGTSWNLGTSVVSACTLPPPNSPPLIAVSPGQGTTPQTITVTVTPAGRPPCKYSASIPVQSARGTARIEVIVNVTAPGFPIAGVDTTSLSLQARSGSNPVSHALRILNKGGGVLNWSAGVATASGGNWLSVSPVSGSATVAAPSTAPVTVNPSALAPGIYTGSISIREVDVDEALPVNVSVTLVVLPSAPVMQLNHRGLSFTTVEGASQIISQGLAILNPGPVNLNWTLQPSTLSGGNWLQVSESSGHSDPGAVTFPQVQVSVNPAGLVAGQYYGLLRITAPGAANSPQTVTVHLNVLAKWKTPALVVQPQALIFVAPGGAAPASQTLRITNTSASAVQAFFGTQTLTGGGWLSADQVSLMVNPGFPNFASVSVNPNGLPPGTYRGQITIQFSDGSPAAVTDVLLLVSSASGPAPAGVPRADDNCAPTRLQMLLTSIGNNFALPVSWPSSLDAVVVDDCGNFVPNATVVASFSNGDPALVLSSLFNGTYTATWKPANPGSGVTISARASLPPLADAAATVSGGVQSNPGAPALFAGGLVNAASFAPAAPLSPGGIISVFGRGLAGSGVASNVPLPFTLGGAVLNVGGVDSPLFFTSDGQLNVQLPAEIPPNSTQLAYVRVRTTPNGPEAITVPEPVTVAGSRPGLFSTNQQGTGQGAVLNVQGVLVDASAPAAVGQTIELFATGLGPTSPAVPSGQGAPGAEPLARVTANVQANVGGQPAHVDFAGLAPNFVGLYQVNVVVPSGIAPNSATPVFITVDGIASNIVTIATR